jgi:hypothetical protein
MALISMMIILFTVVTQGFFVPAESRGTFDRSLLLVNDGIFQAIGVISFGMLPLSPLHLPNVNHSDTSQHSFATIIPS